MPQTQAQKESQRRYRQRKRAEARTAAANVDTTNAQDMVFDVEDAPEDTFPTEEKQGAINKVFSALGLKSDTPEEKEQKAYPSAKLTKQQQAVYDAWTPLAISGFVLCAGWCWKRIEPDYGHLLAPSEDVANKIIAPLMRIYARMSKVGTTLNPNHVDAAAAMAALIGYAWTSVGLWQEIQQAKQENEANGSTANTASTELRARSVDANQSGDVNADPGRSHIRRHAANGNGNSTVSGAADGVNLGNLTEVERRAYEKLSTLRERDYQSRARRSGIA